ncbi:MAG TPA: hypothetical protein P5069_15560 [Candidatus Hydrogenedentes bacterium]|nr:hypothetical protein [Candidatus Hydrogenedentota bacterium]HRZ83866.1 hypothetical protein [Candidatus Hydrogenedentota bacterium]
MMRFLAFSLFAALMLAPSGCFKPAPPSQQPASPVSAPAAAAGAPEAAPVPQGIDIGDVESSIAVSATVPREGLPPQVTVEEMTTARERLALCTVTVRPPYPASLTLRMTLEPQRGFAERPVVLRGAVHRDDTPLSPALETVVGASGTATPAAPAAARPLTVDVDLMQGLSAPPETLLAVGKLDAFLMDAGTPEAGLDPATATSSSRTVLQSNPVRVNFVREGAAQ